MSLEILRSKATTDVPVARGEAAYALYAELLKDMAAERDLAGRTEDAQHLRQEPEEVAEEYLARQPRGPWAELAESLV